MKKMVEQMAEDARSVESFTEDLEPEITKWVPLPQEEGDHGAASVELTFAQYLDFMSTLGATDAEARTWWAKIPTLGEIVEAVKKSEDA